jgi:hypothetical protein
MKNPKAPKKRVARAMKTSGRSATAPRTRRSRRVFVSHASVDAKLVGGLVDLLKLGIGLAHEDLFCTSEKGGAPEVGRCFTEEIRRHLKDATCVVAVLTEAYWKSPVCVAELGAAWYDRKKLLLPLLVPPQDYKDLLGVANQTEALKVDFPKDLDRMRDELATRLGMHGKVPTATWNAKKDAFIASLSGLIGSASTPAPQPDAEASLQHMKQVFRSMNAGPRVHFQSDQETKKAGVPYRVRFNGEVYETRELLGLLTDVVSQGSAGDEAFWALLHAARNLRIATWELSKRPDCAWSRDEWLLVAEALAALEQAHGESVRRFWDVSVREVGVYDEGGQFLGTATYIPPGAPNGAPDGVQGLLMGAPPDVRNHGRYVIETSGLRLPFVAHSSAGGGSFFMRFR